MFLRVVFFQTCKKLWEKSGQPLEPLDLLLALQYCEWFENLSITSHLFNKETQLVYTFWISILNNEGMIEKTISPLQLERYKRLVHEAPKEFGHLSFRHFRAELTRDNFLNFIFNHVISKRRLNRKHLPPPSHFKRSSDHSSSSSRSSSRGRTLSPKVRFFSLEEQSRFLELTTQERKFQLLGGSP